MVVVVPCFGDGALLREALRSLDDQEQCELVVVDDGSTDATTRQVLGELERAGVCVLRQPHRGPSAARNAAVAASRAPYVLPLDADDLLAPGALTVLADALDADRSLSLVWGTQVLFGPHRDPEPLGLRTRELDPWRITHLNEIPSASLVRRSALEAVGGWRDGTGYEDWDLWLALAEHGCRGAGLPVPVHLHRMHRARRCEAVSQDRAGAVAELRAAHPQLFGRRPEHWRRSRSALPVKLLLPLVGALPTTGHRRWQLTFVVTRPRSAVRTLAARSRARLSMQTP